MLSRTCAACLPIALIGWACADNPTRTWTGAEGETVEAEFIRTQDRYAILKTPEKTVRVPMRLLVEADQQWIDRYEELNRPRTWGRSDAEQIRGRFLDVSRGDARIKLGREVQRIAVTKLSADDQSHIARVYEHLGKELPEGVTDRASASSASESAPPDLSKMVEREWTDRTGRTIAAGYLGTRGVNVVMWRSDREFVYPLARLSEADQEWVAEQNLQLLANDLWSGWSAATSLVAGPAPPSEQPEAATDLPPPRQRQRQQRPLGESRLPVR